MPLLEGKAALEEEAASLREQLQEEKTQRLLKEQVASRLQDKVRGLEERESALERQVREKEAALIDSESSARDHRQKAQRAKDKVSNQIHTLVESSPTYQQAIFIMCLAVSCHIIKPP